MSGPPPAGAKPTAPKGPWGQQAPQGPWAQPARSGPSSDPPAAAPSNPLFKPPPAGTTSVLDRNTKAAPPPTEPEPESDAVEITDDIGISISPLYKDKTADETVTNIFALLNSVGVRNFDVKAVRVNLKEGYAKIELPEKAIEEYLVKTLRETYKLKNQFNFSTITDDFEKFSVKRLNNYVDPIIQVTPAPVLVDSKTSMPSLPPCDCPETIFYNYGQNIGFESRQMEFKAGGYISKNKRFQELLGKYLCGFLNSGGGILYFGVDDSGVVKGLTITASGRARIHRNINIVVGRITPGITESDYSVNFAQVKDADGEVMEEVVVEFCVKPRRPRSDTDEFYVYEGHVYVRFEGSCHRYPREKWTKLIS